MEYEKTFEFGKIDFNKCGRKINKVTVDARLFDCNGHLAFAAMGGIWNNLSTDIICGGQCLDEIKRFIHSSLFKKLYGWWKKYHLKDDVIIPENVLVEMKKLIIG